MPQNGIRTHDPNNQAAKTYAIDGEAICEVSDELPCFGIERIFWVNNHHVILEDSLTERHGRELNTPLIR
jgi:hypothetical protein